MLSILSALIVLGLLIVVHEFGHFIVAKLSGVGVEVFSIGFGPRLFWRKNKGTEYRISAIPFGGYVKMIGESPDEVLEDTTKSFSHKPVGTRMAVVAAGPVFNLLLAILIFTIIFSTGVPVLISRVGQVQEDFPAMEAGVEPGDLITSLDGRRIQDWEGLTGIIHGSSGKALQMTIERRGREIGLTITPKESKVENIFGEETTIGLIGISPSGETMKKRYDILTAVKMGFGRTWDIISLTFIGIAKIFQRVVPASTIGGPLMIVQLAGEQAKMGVLNLIFLIAFLSIELGIFNLFPIPILDGGHIFIFSIEAFRGRPLSMKKREIIQQIGLLLLISLFLFAFYNDIMRMFVK